MRCGQNDALSTDACARNTSDKCDAHNCGTIPTAMLKCVTIYADISIADDIIDILGELGIESYTRFPRIVGKGPMTGARLDTHVWPGANTGFQVIVEEADATRLMDRLGDMRASAAPGAAGIFAFQTAVERSL